MIKLKLTGMWALKHTLVEYIMKVDKLIKTKQTLYQD